MSDTNVTILHINDYHNRFEPANQDGGRCTVMDETLHQCYGGFARLVTQVDELRSTKSNVLLVDAGDQYQGTSWFIVFQGKAAGYFMNYLQYDVMALGNHEFDSGISGLVPFLENVTFPVISVNIDATHEPQLDMLYRPSAVLDLDGGDKIGFIGYTTQDTPISTSTGDLIFLDEIEAIQAEVDRLTSEGITKIVALGHSGYTKDLEIAEKVRGVDLVIGGHSHTLLYSGEPPVPEDVAEGPYPTLVNSAHELSYIVPVVTAYRYGKYLGHLQLTFDDDGNLVGWEGNPIILDSSVAEDTDALNEVGKWRSDLNAATAEIIGETHVFLDGRGESCRFKECNMGNMLCDAAIWYYHKVGVKDANLAIWNGDGIQESFYEGNITLGDLMNVLPYEDTIDLLELKGADIMDILEYSVHLYDGVSGETGFLQMGGIRVTFDTNMPAYQRVVKAEVICSECDVPQFVTLDMDTTYKLICNSFLAAGGHGYSMIVDNKLSHHIGKNKFF
uniref:5'-nucleotidase n=1 Tax=Saccoglossus kowalevskii TaxID=10224 RepID=A0ABM0GS60_SACKO|nr:PREDICTED: 5'-nucleotidase-like [Saccoglossus kowalevskii]